MSDIVSTVLALFVLVLIFILFLGFTVMFIIMFGGKQDD